jgi:hypothetical protein
VIKILNDKSEIEEIGELFKFGDEFYDAFNIFTSSVNTFIIFYWVNNKLSQKAIGAHSNMIRISFILILIYYTVFIFILFFPRTIIDFKTKFLLFPDFKTDSRYIKGSILYYIGLTCIILNIINQVIILNFYYTVIKNLIIREKTSYYFKGRR